MRISRRAFASVLALAALGAPAAARAQTAPVALGVQLGYSRAGFTDVGGGTLNESRDGTLFGVFVDRRVAGPVGAQLELFIAKRGGGLTGTLDGVPIRISAQLVYLDFPLLARVAIPVGSRHVRPVIFGGGSASFNIGCDFQAEVPGQVVQVTCGDSAAGGVGIRGVDFGAIVGGGLEYSWRRSALRLELRETFGLRTVTTDAQFKNRTWAMLFGFTI
ncbi:MAG TPA: outer membrane beta-barrel protein [Gemmatimonadales bacterium]|nr:outer membrane beta-barrel protein [Gemmatimonadales bacterium]